MESRIEELEGLYNLSNQIIENNNSGKVQKDLAAKIKLVA